MTPPPRGGARTDPRGTVGRIYKEEHYILLQTKYESSGPCGFVEKDFLCFTHDSPGAGSVWDLMTPGAGSFLTPGTWLAGFIKRTTKHCYTQNMKALGLVVSEKKIFFFYIFSQRRPWGGARMNPRGTVGRIYEEDH